MKGKIFNGLSYIARTFKVGLAMVLPVLFTGSITVLINGFPVRAYQDFMSSFLGGALRQVCSTVQVATIGCLAVHLTIAVNLSFMNQLKEKKKRSVEFGSLLACLAGFFILSGFFSGEADITLLSGQGVFSALISGVIGSELYRRFEALYGPGNKVFLDEADSVFNAALQKILPFLSVVVCFAAVNYLVTIFFDVKSVQHLFMKVMDLIFLSMKRSYSSGLLFIVLTSLMWWFGIHGNNVLDQVASDLFTEIIPGQIVSKSFMDTFVIMGGTGCLIGLLAAMLIFGKRSSTRKLLRMAWVPCFFNISELLVFGFPVVYNPYMMIPFLLSPALCYTNAFLLSKAGFMPLVTKTVVWTTPPLLSGYIATGSLRGLAVQLMNILISTACYAPFIMLYENKTLNEYPSEMEELFAQFKRGRDSNEELKLTETDGNAGRLARLLATDLEDALIASSGETSAKKVENPISVEYEEQYDEDGKCVGARALLKWEHIRCGLIDPELVLQLAEESGILYSFETYVTEEAIKALAEFLKSRGGDFRMVIKVTESTILDRNFPSFLQTMADGYRLRAGNIALEITEETCRKISGETGEDMNRLCPFGFLLMVEKK